MSASKQLGVVVRGKQHEWIFHFNGDPAYLQEWRDDGLDVHVVENVIPAWVADLGMARPWCFVQDLLNFRNPWRK